MRLRAEPWPPVCTSTEVSKRDDIARHATGDVRREIVPPLRVMNIPVETPSWPARLKWTNRCVEGADDRANRCLLTVIILYP
jgi:hypothetical protein